MYISTAQREIYNIKIPTLEKIKNNHPSKYKMQAINARINKKCQKPIKNIKQTYTKSRKTRAIIFKINKIIETVLS
jgi:hypothetical protein